MDVLCGVLKVISGFFTFSMPTAAESTLVMTLVDDGEDNDDNDKDDDDNEKDNDDKDKDNDDNDKGDDANDRGDDDNDKEKS